MTINKVGGQSAQASTEVSSETQATTGSPSDSQVKKFDAALHGQLPELPDSDPTDADDANVLSKELQEFEQRIETGRDKRLTLDWDHGAHARSGNEGDPASFDPTFGLTSVDSTFDPRSHDIESLRQEAEASYQEYKDKIQGG